MTDLDRLMANVSKQPNGCWYWTGYINKDNYGRVGYQGCSSVPAYRAVYTELVGPIPAGMSLDHTCHSNDDTCAGGKTCMHRRCVNPGHLEPCTKEENSSRGVFGKRTHCPKNHPYDEANTRVYRGRRFCIACVLAAAARAASRRRHASATKAVQEGRVELTLALGPCDISATVTGARSCVSTEVHHLPDGQWYCTCRRTNCLHTLAVELFYAQAVPA